jgi:glycosyltransferase involved in cell wall biosynthesis
MLASCLCVTEARPAFMPWLWWNFEKQTHPLRELVVVDSSPEPYPFAEEVRVVRCAPGTSVAAKRNLALTAAAGDLVSWFDDDDWQHPRKVELLADALSSRCDLAGSRQSWVVDLASLRCRPTSPKPTVLFNTVGVHRRLWDWARFDEGRVYNTDLQWLAALAPRAFTRILPEPLAMLLFHGGNMTPEMGATAWTSTLHRVTKHIDGDWSETFVQLGALRRRLHTLAL